MFPLVLPLEDEGEQREDGVDAEGEDVGSLRRQFYRHVFAIACTAAVVTGGGGIVVVATVLV